MNTTEMFDLVKQQSQKFRVRDYDISITLCNSFFFRLQSFAQQVVGGMMASFDLFWFGFLYFALLGLAWLGFFFSFLFFSFRFFSFLFLFFSSSQF